MWHMFRNQSGEMTSKGFLLLGLGLGLACLRAAPEGPRARPGFTVACRRWQLLECLQASC